MEKKLETFDAAKILNVTPNTVRDLERRGRLPAERTASGTRLFKQADVERLAAERAAQRKLRGGK